MKKLPIFLLFSWVCLAQIHNSDPAALGGIVGSTANGSHVGGNRTNLVLQTKPFVDVRDFGAVGDAKVAIARNAAGFQSWSDCWMSAGSAVLNCENPHFSSADVGKVIAVYGAGFPGAGNRQPLASTIQSYQSPTRVSLADIAKANLTQDLCSITTATWTIDGTLTATCRVPHGFYVGQAITIDWSNDPDIDRQQFFITTVNRAKFTASGNGLPEGPHTFGNILNGNPVQASGRSPRVVWGTDNTAALQAAVDSQAKATNDDMTGAEIYFPPGHYLTNGITADCSYIGYNSCARQYNNFWFHGAGRDTTELENWNPNIAGTESSTSHSGVLFLGYNGITHDASGSFYRHYLRGIKISGLTIRQVANPTYGTLKAVYIYSSDGAEVFDNLITGPSH